MDCCSPAVKGPKYEDDCSRPSGVEIKMKGTIPPPPEMFQVLSVDKVVLFTFSDQSKPVVLIHTQLNSVHPSPSTC